MNQAIKHIYREANFLSLAGNLSISFFGFAGFALLAHRFPPNVFGEWVIYISMAALLDMFRFGITTTAIIRFVSGSPAEDRSKFTGSFILIVLIVTVALAALIALVNVSFRDPIREAGYGLFFTWYPIFAFANLPMSTASVLQQADMRFDRLLLINSLYSIGFFLMLLFDFFFLKLNLNELVIAQIMFSLLTSGVCMIKGWDGLKYIRKASKATTKILLDFGKYTTFTLIGTNLLRSADTLIISLSPMGTAAVALYSIPMKLTELQQIPLRSFAATAFPKMSKASLRNNESDVRNIFYTYSGAMSYLFAVISLITFFFAEYFVMILGGSQYLGTDPATGASAVTIVRIFSIYGLFLPIDRMTGIGLDSINKPARNFQKVMYMALANIIGDLIAVFIFKSLAGVAIASIFFTVFGVGLGFYFLKQQIMLDFRKIFSSGIDFYKMMYYKFLRPNYDTRRL